jgi:hypothetical protein
LEARGLASRDFSSSITGEDPSDPYVKVRLGKDYQGDSRDWVDDVTDLDWFRAYTFKKNVSLPGESRLHVEVWDHDDFTFDDLIGTTVIDLEDRLLDQRWSKYEPRDEKNRRRGRRTGSSLPLKPVENRTLYPPHSAGTAVWAALSGAKAGAGQPTGSQGQIRLWVDILSTSESRAPGNSMVDIALAPTLEWELRVIIYSCTGRDSRVGDPYIKVALENEKGAWQKQDTDVHFRVTKAAFTGVWVGSYNWRLKFKVDLGPRSWLVKNPNLNLQLWDQDILKWNDCIAQSTLSLQMLLLTALEKTKTSKTAAARSGSGGGGSANIKAVEKEARAAAAKAVQEVKLEHFKGPPGLDLAKEKVCTRIHHAVIAGAQMTPKFELRTKETKRERKTRQQAEGRNALPSTAGIADGHVATPPSKNDSAEDIVDFFKDHQGLLRQVPGLPAEVAGLKKAMAKLQKTLPPHLRSKQGKQGGAVKGKRLSFRDKIKKAREEMGLSLATPENAGWVKLKDPATRRTVARVLLGIELVSKQVADRETVGMGQQRPNHQPTLPPPVGRMSLTLNPLDALKHLLPCWLICSLVCCVFFLQLVMQLPTIMATYMMLQQQKL